MRKRATAVVVGERGILLVRDSGKSRFSLPGGGIDRHESVLAACIREIYEELAVDVFRIQRLKNCDFEGRITKHLVCLAELESEPAIEEGGELAELLWWRGNRSHPLRFRHVDQIVGRWQKMESKKHI